MDYCGADMTESAVSQDVLAMDVKTELSDAPAVIPEDFEEEEEDMDDDMEEFDKVMLEPGEVISQASLLLPPVSGLAVTNLSNLANLSNLSNGTGTAGSSPELASDRGDATSECATRRHRCKKCDDRFATKELLWQHARDAHMNPSRVLQCQFCPFATELRHHFDFHIKSHTGEKPFQCTLCDYRCKNRGMLTSHRKSHQAGYDFFCADCNFRAKFKSNMHSHAKRTNHRQAEWPSERVASGASEGQDTGALVPVDGVHLAQGLPVPVTSSEVAVVAAAVAAAAKGVRLPVPPMPGDSGGLQLLSPGKPFPHSMPMPVMSAGIPPAFAPLRVPHGGLMMLPPAGEPLPCHITPTSAAAPITPVSSCSPAAHLSSLSLPGNGEQMRFFLSEAEKVNPADVGFIMSQMSQLHRSLPRPPPHLPPHTTAAALNGVHRLPLWPLLPPALAAAAAACGPRGPPPLAPLHPPLQDTSPVSTRSGGEESSSPPPTSGEEFPTPANQSSSPPPGLPNECAHCRMVFRDEAMHDLHRGYHTHENPFKCNRCGYQAEDRLDFTLHLYKSEHK